MEENLNEKGMNGNDAPRTYGEESQMYENGGQPNYGAQSDNGDQPNYSQQPNYGGQPGFDSTQGYPSGYNSYQPQPTYGAVTDVFCYILLAIMPLRIILGWGLSAVTYAAMDSYESILDGSYMANLTSGSYGILSALGNLLLVALIIFLVLDIVKIYKAGYKITGLVLFAIFLKPGYYIWRAHLLGRKKVLPIVYTVIFSILSLAYYGYSFYMSFVMAGQLMQGIY